MAKAKSPAVSGKSSKPAMRISAAESKRRSLAMKQMHAEKRGLTLYIIVTDWGSRVSFGRPWTVRPGTWSEYTSVRFEGPTAGDNEIASRAVCTVYGELKARDVIIERGKAADQARIGHFTKQRDGHLDVAAFVPLELAVAITAAAAGGKIEQILLELDLPKNGHGQVRSISVGSGQPDI